MAKRQRLFVAAAAVVVTCIAAAVPRAASAQVDVVATLGDLGAAARAVGGEDVDVQTLARPQADPHYVDAKPNYIRTLSGADLLLVNGMSLEIGWLPELLENARNGTVQEGQEGYFDASTVIERMGVPDTSVTRKMGDVHPEGNPHYTLDPRQMARVSLALADRLAELDPAHADAYESRGRSFAKECLKVADKWKEKFGELPEARRRVGVYHESWEYVLDWLGLEKVATVEPKPGVDPNPKHVADVVETLDGAGAPAVLKLEYYGASTARRIADKVGAELVSSQGHTRDGQDYIDRVDRLAESIYEALRE